LPVPSASRRRAIQSSALLVVNHGDFMDVFHGIGMGISMGLAVSFSEDHINNQDFSGYVIYLCHMYICIYTRIYIYTHIIYTCIYIYICMYIYIYLYPPVK